MSKAVYVISAVRTPMGSFLGALCTVPATDLGAAAIRGALEKGGVAADRVEEVFMGNVLQAGLAKRPRVKQPWQQAFPTTYRVPPSTRCVPVA